MTTKRITAAVLAGALVTGAALAGMASTAEAGPGLAASATGSGHFLIGEDLRTFAFTAHTTAAGVTSGEGQVNNRSQGVTSHLKIDCLSVSGNIATVSGFISESSNPDIVGQYMIFRVIDNGEGRKATAADLVSLVFFRPGVPYDCSLAWSIAMNPIARGNVQVH